MNFSSMDEAVAAAIKEHHDWHRRAKPSTEKVQPRVTVVDGEFRKQRRPTRVKGRYFVRWAGTAELTDPRVEDGQIVFTPRWDFKLEAARVAREQSK